MQGKGRHTGLGVDEDLYLHGGEDAINAAIFQQERHLPLAEALAQLRAVHQELRTAIQPLSDADLQKPYRHYLPNEPGDGDGPPAMKVVYGNSPITLLNIWPGLKRSPRKNNKPLAYSRAFFGFQLTFAQRLAERFALTLAEVLQQYTTLTRSIALEHRDEYLAGLQIARDPTEWTYQWHVAQRVPGPQPDDSTLYGRALFGCFHYSVRNDRTGHGTIIRPHFIKNDQAGYHALGHERLAVRRAEVGRMFTHIHAHVPLATTVLGNSWLYNLAAYQRVYPPAYTLHLPAIQHDEFQYLSLWGQCFDRHWQPKTTVTTELLRRLDLLADLADLRSCFPYAVRRPQCGIGEFYSFFAIDHKE